MLIPHKPLQAYLLDIATQHGESGNESWLAGCLAYASALEHILDSLDLGVFVDCTRLDGLIDDHNLLPSHSVTLTRDVVPRLYELTVAVAEEAELRGALQMAYSALALLDRLPQSVFPLGYARVLAARARIARKSDALVIAEELYRRVAALARQLSSDELSARALIGRGVIAHARGNYPAARSFYSRAAIRATTCEEPSLVRNAYHGLMVVAAKYGQFGEALTAGWLAFQGAAGDPEIEADMLINLAQLAFEVGDPSAALHAFAAALTREPAPWRRLPALGGAARAAAALDREPILRECASRVLAFEASGTGFAYSRATALLDVCRAFGAMSRPTESADFAARAHVLASLNGFHELILMAEQLMADLERGVSLASKRPGVAEAETPLIIDAEGRFVLGRLTSLGHPDRVLVHT